MVVLYDGRRRQRGDYLHTPRLQKEPAEPQSCFFFKYILYVYMYVVIYIYIYVCVFFFSFVQEFGRTSRTDITRRPICVKVPTWTCRLKHGIEANADFRAVEQNQRPEWTKTDACGYTSFCEEQRVFHWNVVWGGLGSVIISQMILLSSCNHGLVLSRSEIHSLWQMRSESLNS